MEGVDVKQSMSKFYIFAISQLMGWLIHHRKSKEQKSSSEQSMDGIDEICTQEFLNTGNTSLHPHNLWTFRGQIKKTSAYKDRTVMCSNQAPIKFEETHQTQDPNDNR